MATGLEQLSRMCWAANWALTEKEQAQASAVLAKQGRPRAPVDVRLNFVVGDAVDTCDALCLLSSEGLGAWGKARDGDEVCVCVCCVRVGCNVSCVQATGLS